MGPLYSGLCCLLNCYTVRGLRFLPDKAINFKNCDPALNECPANSTCEETTNNNINYYKCGCDITHFNVKDKLTITYPGGECLELCGAGKPFPCACNRRGYISKLNKVTGFFECTDKCTDYSDCPTGATCTKQSCYCTEGCKQPQGTSCITLVKLDEVCGVLTTTTSSPLTSNGNTEKTAVYTQHGATTQQPVLSSTTGLLLTSNVNMGDTTAYTLLDVQETHNIPFTTSPGETSVTSHSMSQKTSEEPEALTTQPVYDRCQSKSRDEQECEKHNNTGPACTFLKSIEHVKEDACEGNITNTVQKVASQITDLINRTSLETLNLSDLQTVIAAIIDNVETSLLASFSADPRNEQINTPEIEAEIKVFHDHCGNGSSVILRVQDNKMEVPCSLVDSADGGAMFISYKCLNSRINGSILAAFGESDETGTEEVISPVVGGAITNPNTENLASPVTFTLIHQKAVKSFHTPLCVFWDTHREVWSTHGCTTQESEQENSTRCVCTHLSTFAVLMAPTEIQVDTGLRVISTIGLSISLVCLFLSFLTFILCRSLRSAHTSILTVLCGCLFLGQLLVLVGLGQTWNKTLCSVIAGSLQFIFLCAFCWMSLESILLFLTVRNLQAVNYMNSQRSYFPYLCLIGFGIPIIIIVISGSLYPHIYGEETHCWLKLSHIWIFLGPVSIFISVNFTLLVLTFWLLKKKLASLNSNVSTLKHTRLMTFKALSQLFILGCTWIIGIFQFGPGAIVASYIFTICNSLQGLYILIVHCLLNRQVREEYSRAFFRWSKKSTSETMSGSTMPMTLKQVFINLPQYVGETPLVYNSNEVCVNEIRVFIHTSS
ncbi:adhesion G protein-coupled receptor E3-like isoform X2 [Hyla sarda]|uniref:adhesion G protein-coupled receptor E3-like isoform X2 n=1 Tax=Hyla sarda TaxID=327740 RepID=UPI0024C3ED5C|nr:adhesion G protein-coupled receptor E3-like isoform X2 [Hyla sarda]